jgi:hypothetical protein
MDSLGDALELHLRSEGLRGCLGELGTGHHHRPGGHHHLSTDLVGDTRGSMRSQDMSAELCDVTQSDLRGQNELEGWHEQTQTYRRKFVMGIYRDG